MYIRGLVLLSIHKFALCVECTRERYVAGVKNPGPGPHPLQGLAKFHLSPLLCTNLASQM